MNYTQEEISRRIESTYAIFARQRGEHAQRMEEFRVKGYISEHRRVDFECRRDITMTNYKEFVANLPDLDDEIEISFDGDLMSFYVYQNHQLRAPEALDKLWAWSATAIAQYRYYLANQHILIHMIEKNIEVLTEHHYQGLLHMKMHELETDNVIPEGFNREVGE